jgi:hypothetical protein
MASKRSRSKPKTRSMTSAPTRAPRFAGLGPPLLLEGEDAALYDDLVGRMWAAVKPVDIIDELYVADVVALQWEILRWRRLKFGLLQASVHAELQAFLHQRLGYAAYAEDFAEALAEILANILPESPPKDVAEEAKELAQQVLGEALRRNLQIEEGEFEVIETTPATAQRPVPARRESRTAPERTHRTRDRRFSSRCGKSEGNDPA